MKTRLFLLLLLFALAGGPVHRAQAEDTAPPETSGLRLTVSAGLDKQCRQETWMPVWITVENTGLPLEQAFIEIVAGTDVYRIAADLPLHSRKTFETYISASWQEALKVRLTDGEMTLAEKKILLTCGGTNNVYVGVWSADVRTAAALSSSAITGKGFRQAFLSEAFLPTQAIGLEALEALVIGADSDSRTLSAEQLEAIRTWTLSGGNTLVFGGGNWTYALGLDDMLPFHPQGSRVVASLPGLEMPAGASLTLSSGNLAQDARILAGDGSAPLVISHPFGHGRVTYTTFDPRTLPAEQVWALLAPLWNEDALEGKTALQTPLTLNTSFSNDAHDALHILPHQPASYTYWLGLMIGAYLLAVGPLNFRLLRGRREWIWGSSLAIAGLFTFLFIGTGSLLRGKPLANQLLIVRTWPEARSARADGLLGIYAPRRGTYTYQANSDLWAFPMQEYAGANDYPRPTVEHANGSLRFPGVRMNVNDMLHTRVAASRDAPRYQGNLTLQISPSRPELVLSGSFTWEEDFPLQDAVLIWGSTWSELGDIKPGDTRTWDIRESDSEHNTNATAQIMGGMYLSYHAYDNTPLLRQRHLMLSALLGREVLANADRAVIAGWSDPQHGLPLQWRQNNHTLRTEGQTLYLISLPIEQNALEGQAFTYRMIIPPHLYEQVSYNTGEDTTVKAQIPLHVPPGTTITGLTIRVKGNQNLSENLSRLDLWNFRIQDFETCIARDDIFTPPGNPADYISPLGHYRIRITPLSDADYIIIDAIEMELEFTPLPPGQKNP